MKKVAYLIFATIVLFNSNIVSQVTIGSAEKPLQGILLDIKTVNSEISETAKQGVLLPRVALEDKYKLDPIITTTGLSPTDLEQENKRYIGAIVFNVTASGLLEQALHYWDGMEWINVDKAVVSMRVDDEANTFLVPTVVNKVEVPTTRAAKVWKEYAMLSSITSQTFNNKDLDNLAATATVEAKLLWADTPNLITRIHFAKGDTHPISEGKIVASGRGNRAGNAVVALLVNNEIVWSWHLWFTNYNPNTTNIMSMGEEPVEDGYIYRSNNSSSDDGYFIWMDRNLGSSTNDLSSAQYNMFYQWGRKDPFPPTKTLGGTNITLYDINGNPTNIQSTTALQQHPLEASIKEPNKLLLTTAVHANSDWFLSSTANTSYFNQVSGIMKSNNIYLWSDGGEKSLFDPCPSTWRVAYATNQQTPWNRPDVETMAYTSYSSQAFNNGFNFDLAKYKLGNYPATGYINGTTGLHVDNGTRGIVWSAATNTLNQSSLGLMLYSGTVNTAQSLKRSHAVAVRCVKIMEKK